jgi:hypothetical protein
MKIDTQNTTALNKLADQSRQLRRRFEPQWFLNLAYYVGDQWVYWNHGRLDRPTVPKHRMLLTENRILPVVLTRLAKKTKQQPVWTVTPNSPDDSDIDAAELGETVMESMWKTLCMQQKLFTVLEWADVCSAGFWKVTWDSTAGESVNVIMGADGKPIEDQQGRMMKAADLKQIPQGLSTKTISQGDVCLEVRSPFEILPDPLGKDIESCEWIIEEVVQSEEYVWMHHGQRVKADTEVTGGPSDSRFFPSWQTGGGNTSYRGVKVRELWIRPNSQFPKGRRTVWARDKVLFDDDSPYEQLPYVMFRGLPVPGRFWPTSITEQLREPQTELNKIKSQIRENAQRIGNPMLLRSRLANVKYTGVPGEEVLYDDTTANATPSYLQPPEMPNYVVQEIDRILEAFREISGQHEVSNSQVPAGVTAASAINLLLEQDDTRLGPTITEMETSLSYSGKMVLRLIGQYYTEERMVGLVGEDQNYDFISFKGEALKDNNNVEVQAGSAFPASKAAKQAAIQQTLTLMIQNGQPVDARTMRKILRDYQVGGLEAFFSDVGRDEAQVNRENRLMYQGQPLPINPFDEDETHVAGHQDEMKSNRFFRAPPPIQALFVAHVQLHQDRLQKAHDAAQADQMHQMVQQTQVQAAPEQQQLSMQAHFDQLAAGQQAAYKLQQIYAQQQGKSNGANS